MEQNKFLIDNMNHNYKITTKHNLYPQNSDEQNEKNLIDKLNKNYTYITSIAKFTMSS